MKENTSKTGGAHGNGYPREVANGANPKGKKHDANLRKTGFLRFQLGLIIALLLTYFGLEASFGALDETVATVGLMVPELLEYHPDLDRIQVEKEVKVTEETQKVVNPTEFKEVDNDAVIEEGKEFIQVPSKDSHNPKLNPDDIFVEKKPDEIEEIPFILLEDVPIFPGCEKVKDKRECFNEMMQQHILNNLKYPEFAVENNIQGRVNVVFKINEFGEVTNIRMRGPSAVLEDEAKRLMDILPKMTPGKQRGRAVRVPFSIPINFKLK